MPKKTVSLKKRSRATSPEGLRAAFSMTFDGHFADAAFPHAQRIVTALTTTRDTDVQVDELARAVFSHFPNLGEPPELATAQEAAFNVGFATCWLLMRQVNGGGAR